MYDQKPAEINVTPHPSTRESSGKVQPIRRCLGTTLLDSTSFIGGKCDLSNGSGKSPGLNQFAFCSYGETALAVFARGKKSRGDFFLFCAKPESHSDGFKRILRDA